MNRNQIKANLYVFGGLAIVFILIVVVLSFSNRNDEENFPQFDRFSIEDDMSDEQYEDTRDRLQRDVYFANEVLIGEFDSEEYMKMITDTNYDFDHYKGASFRELLWHFIHSFEINNTEYLSSLNKKESLFCMKKRYATEAFNELYGVDVSNQLQYLPGYIDYASINSSGSYCFNYGQILKEYDNEIKVGVERIAVTGNNVTTDIYVYEYKNNNSDDQILAIRNLDIYIKNKDFDSANKVVKNHLYGKVTHKQVKLKLNSRGKFFKYQILKVKILDY